MGAGARFNHLRFQMLTHQTRPLQSFVPPAEAEPAIRVAQDFAVGTEFICGLVDGGVFCRGDTPFGEAYNETITPEGFEAGVSKIAAGGKILCGMQKGSPIAGLTDISWVPGGVASKNGTLYETAEDMCPKPMNELIWLALDDKGNQMNGNKFSGYVKSPSNACVLMRESVWCKGANGQGQLGGANIFNQLGPFAEIPF